MVSRNFLQQWKDGIKDITILEMRDPGTFWVKEARSVDMSEEAQNFWELEKQIWQEYELDDFTTDTYKPRKGEICCIKWRKKNERNFKWVRVKVLAKIQGAERTLIRVLLVDYYVEITVPEKSLKKCEPHFLNVPFQAVEVHLNGIIPKSMSIQITDRMEAVNLPNDSWDASALVFVRKLLEEHTKAQLEVMKIEGNNILLGRLHLYIQDEIICVNDLLQEEDYAYEIDDLGNIPAKTLDPPSRDTKTYKEKMLELQTNLVKDFNGVMKVGNSSSICRGTSEDKRPILHQTIENYDLSDVAARKTYQKSISTENVPSNLRPKNFSIGRGIPTSLKNKVPSPRQSNTIKYDDTRKLSRSNNSPNASAVRDSNKPNRQSSNQLQANAAPIVVKSAMSPSPVGRHVAANQMSPVTKSVIEPSIISNNFEKRVSPIADDKIKKSSSFSPADSVSSLNISFVSSIGRGKAIQEKLKLAKMADVVKESTDKVNDSVVAVDNDECKINRSANIKFHNLQKLRDSIVAANNNESKINKSDDVKFKNVQKLEDSLAAADNDESKINKSYNIKFENLNKIKTKSSNIENKDGIKCVSKRSVTVTELHSGSKSSSPVQRCVQSKESFTNCTIPKRQRLNLSSKHAIMLSNLKKSPLSSSSSSKSFSANSNDSLTKNLSFDETNLNSEEDAKCDNGICSTTDDEISSNITSNHRRSHLRSVLKSPSASEGEKSVVTMSSAAVTVTSCNVKDESKGAIPKQRSKSILHGEYNDNERDQSAVVTAVESKISRFKDFSSPDEASCSSADDEYTSYRQAFELAGDKDDDFYKSTWNSASFNTNMMSTFDTLNEHIRGLAYSKGVRVPAPYTRVDSHFCSHLVEQLRRLNFKEPSVIQKYAWPSICRGRNVAVVAESSAGNVLVYLVPILSSLMEVNSYCSIPDGNGPLAVIFCISSESAEHLYNVIKNLSENSRVKCHVLHSGLEDAVKTNLLNGCDILISTPCSFMRVFKQIKGKFTNLNRICHLVFNDADRLMKLFNEQVKMVMNEYLRVIHQPARLDTAHQVITCGTEWNNSISQFIDSYFQDSLQPIMTDPIIHFTNFFEAAIHADVETFVHFVDVDCLQRQFLEVIDGCKNKKTIIFTSSHFVAKQLYDMLHSLSYFVIRADMKMSNYELNAVKDNWERHHNANSAPLLVFDDACIPSMIITDAECIIHYDIPELSKSQFGLRFSTMMKNFGKNNVTVADNVNERESLTCFIFVTNKCMIQAPKLVELLFRLGKCPTELIKLAKMQIEKVEKSKSAEPFCPYIKAYGECRFYTFTGKRCSYRHKLCKDSDEPCHHNPVDGIVRLQIVKVIDAGHFMAHIVERGNEDCQIYKDHFAKSVGEYRKVALEMALHFSKQANNRVVSPQELEIGCVYGFRNKDGILYRVKVSKIVKTSASGEPSIVLVIFVDNGTSDEFAVDKLLLLPGEFAAIPPQVVEVFACNIRPRDYGLYWSNNASMYINHVVNKNNRHVFGKVLLSVGNTLWLHPLVVRESMNGSTTFVNVLRLDRELIGRKWGQENKDHLTKLKTLCKASDIPVASDGHDLPKDSPKSTKKDRVQYSVLNKDESYSVKVCTVHNPHRFFVQVCKFCELLDALTCEMTVWANEHGYFMNDFEKDALCIVQQDERWHRAKITDLPNDESVEVFFLDFGDYMNVPKSQIKTLRKEEFLRLPVQAIECSLADVVPPAPSNSWDNCSQDFLEDITVDEDGNLIELSLMVHEKLPADDDLRSRYEVVLRSGLHGKSMGQILVDNGLAEFSPDASKIKDETKRKLVDLWGNTTESDYDLEDLSIKEALDDIRVLKEFESTKSSVTPNVTSAISPVKLTDDESFDDISEVVTPSVRWSENNIKNNVTLSIKLVGVKKPDLNVTDDRIVFGASADGKFYQVDLKLYGRIFSERHDMKISGTEVLVTLPKKEPLESWPRLLDTTEKQPYLGIDFDRNGLDSSDSENSSVPHCVLPQQLLRKFQEPDVESDEFNSDSCPSSLDDRDEFQLFC